MTSPYGGYQDGGQHRQVPPPRRPNGATAIIAALSGLALAGVAAYVPIGELFVDMPPQLDVGDLPGGVLTFYGLLTGAAVFAFIGGLITFFRLVAGAILLLIGALMGTVGIFASPLLWGQDYGFYFDAVFSFGTSPVVLRFLVMVFAPVTLVFAALPPTFKYLTYRAPARSIYGQPSGYPPQQGW